MLELGGLAAFAFARPVLDTFGRSPETFVARGADALTVVLFGFVVAFLPYLLFGVLGLLGRPFGPTTAGVCTSCSSRWSAGSPSGSSARASPATRPTRRS